MHPAMNELLQLPASQRLELVQDLWDSIRQSREELSLQQWHRELVAARLAIWNNSDPEAGLTREEVWQKVDQRRDQDVAND